MVTKVVPMDVRLKIAVASPDLNVAAFCREHGVSRETYYFWKKRYAAEGLEGLEMRSRAPKTSPRRVSAKVEEMIVELREELDKKGVDSGASTIQYHLGKRKCRAVPSVATVWRVLKRRGYVTAQPAKRPKSSYRRFEASAPNELWQADTTDWTIATGVVKILSFLDDHSRVALRVKALASATSEATWETFCEAAEEWGLPLGQLTDNGLNFSGRLRGFEVHFETQLRQAGVVPRTSRPYHPQTCGKVERFQQTLKKWLRRRPMAKNLTQLQAQIDEFMAYYNHVRPHRGIGRVTPVERWKASTPAINLGVALPSPAQHITAVVAANGVVSAGPHRRRAGVGVRYAGCTARVDFDDTHLAVFIDHKLVRAILIDPTQSYQAQKPRRSSAA
jgi:transposase InsO family protein